MTRAAVFLIDGYADWELGFLLPGINDSPEGSIVSFSLDGRPVVSMGGLHVTPDASIDKIRPEDFSILILPGAKIWAEGEIKPITKLGKAFLSADKSVAAICGATLAVGWMGVFEKYAHTSNSVEFLEKHLPRYNGQAAYRDEPAVTGGKLITASGLGAIEFTREVVKMLKLLSDEQVEGWYRALKNARLG
jgi:putative intracellular protease/amidase